MAGMRDEFLSEEQLDLKNLTEEELYAWWDTWLEWAQATNDMDEHTYSHGVFTTEPPWGPVTEEPGLHGRGPTTTQPSPNATDLERPAE